MHTLNFYAHTKLFKREFAPSQLLHSHGFRLRESRKRTQIAYAKDFAYAIFSGGFRRIKIASRTQNRVRKIASRTQNRVELGAIYVRDAILRTRFLLGFY